MSEENNDLRQGLEDRPTRTRSTPACSAPQVAHHKEVQQLALPSQLAPIPDAIHPFLGAITVSWSAASDSGAKVETEAVGVWLNVADHSRHRFCNSDHERSCGSGSGNTKSVPQPMSIPHIGRWTRSTRLRLADLGGAVA